MDDLHLSYFGSQLIHPFMSEELVPEPVSSDVELAQAAAQAMFERDAASKGLGMKIKSMAPGSACVEMPVRVDMLNGHQTCHGGYIFTLADSAFAFACNSHNQNTVSSGCNIDYLLPAYPGDVLTATATELSRGRKTGVYDVTVRNQHGAQIALLRGNSYQVKGTVLSAGSGTPVPSTNHQRN